MKRKRPSRTPAAICSVVAKRCAIYVYPQELLGAISAIVKEEGLSIEDGGRSAIPKLRLPGVEAGAVDAEIERVATANRRMAVNV